MHAVRDAELNYQYYQLPFVLEHIIEYLDSQLQRFRSNIECPPVNVILHIFMDHGSHYLIFLQDMVGCIDRVTANLL